MSLCRWLDIAARNKLTSQVKNNFQGQVIPKTITNSTVHCLYKLLLGWTKTSKKQTKTEQRSVYTKDRGIVFPNPTT